MSPRLRTLVQDLVGRSRASPLAQRLTRGTLWSILGGVLGRGAVLLSGIVVARILGKEAYGALGMIQSTLLMVGVFAGFGMGLTATKYVAEYRVRDPRRAGTVITLTSVVAAVTGVLSAAILYAAAPWLAERTLSAPGLARPLQISSLVFLFTALNGAQVGALSGLESFKALAWVNLWTGLVSIAINSGFVLVGGFTGAVWGLVLSSFVTWAATWFTVRTEARYANVPLSFDARTGEWRILVRYSLPAVLSQIVVGPVRWLSGVMLVNTPNGYAEMGTFSAANQWSQVIAFVAAMIANASIPILSERLGDGDLHSSLRVLKGSIAVTLALLLPCVALGSSLSPWVMGLYGETFRQAWPTLVVSLLAAGVLALQAPVGTVIQASGAMWTGALMNLGWGLATLVFTWVALPLGALGLALASFGAYIVHASWTFAYARRLLRDNPSRVHADVTHTPAGIPVGPAAGRPGVES